jgi:type 1 glutamine amidotransferase
MKKLLASVLFLTFALVCAASARAAEQAAKEKIRVLVTFGGHGFEEKQFWAMLDALPNVAYKKAQLPKEADLLKPGLEKDYDVILMYDMVGGISTEQQKAFVELLNKGIGVVAWHHNMGAHQGWPEFAKIIGGKFFTKPGEIGGTKYAISGWAHGQDMNVTVADKEHPITKGVKDFKIHDEVYNKYYVAPDVKALLTTDNPKNDPKIAWVTQYGKSRVFYLMLGHDHLAWDNASFRQILAQGIQWAAGK